MGLFDYVRCDATLPDGKPTPPDQFQTKDFACPFMEHYTITTAGRLIAHRVRYEEVPEAEKQHKWHLIRAVPIGDEDLNWHGWLNFYGGSSGELREFYAKFIDGQLVEIRQVCQSTEGEIP